MKKLTEENYFTHKGYVRNSLIGIAISNPQRLHNWLQGTKDEESTEALEQGKMIHLYVLQPKQFQTLYAELPQDHDGRKKEGKQLIQEIKDSGRTPVKYEDIMTCKGILNQINKHRLGAALLNMKDRHIEEVITFTLHGEQCACKPDMWVYNKEKEEAHIFDLKTTRSADKNKFIYSIESFGYWRQRNFYVHGLTHHLKEKKIPVKRVKFHIVAIEKKPFLGEYGMNFITLIGKENGEADRAEQQIKEGMQIIKEVKEGKELHEINADPAYSPEGLVIP